MPLSPRRAKSAEQFPKPFEVEPRSEYLVRMLKDPRVKQQGYNTVRARIAAEREWGLARDRAMVCITAFGDQFLMFGDPTLPV